MIGGGPSDDRSETVRSAETFRELAAAHGIHYGGRPLQTRQPSGLEDRVRLDAEMFRTDLVTEFLRLQRILFVASPRVRVWMASAATAWATRLNEAAAAVPLPHHLWVRGDEIVTEQGGVYWAEQEVDDGSLGVGVALERALVGSDVFFRSTLEVLGEVGVRPGGRPLVTFMSASYRPYLGGFRYWARLLSKEGIDHRFAIEGEHDLSEAVDRVVAEGAVVHNFFESHRQDRFFNPQWVPLFEAWMAGRVQVLPAPATLYEWKGWWAVLHHPESLEPEAREILERFALRPAILERLPRSVFLDADSSARVVDQAESIVLKPCFGGGSYGVRIGCETRRGTLRRLIRSPIPSHRHVVQEFARPARVEGRATKLSPHYFLDRDGNPHPRANHPRIVHVMQRRSALVHGQEDTIASVLRLS